VIRDNHVGDWGTQFGMLIEYLLDVGEDSAEAGLLRTDPNAFYQAARRIFDSDPGFAERARKRVVDLQGGDPGTLQLWQEIVDLSLDYLHRIYGRLGVTLTDDDIKGESFYNNLLADTAAQLEEKGIAVYSDGALCAFPPGFTGREGRPLPVIIRKSDGGYNYSTTDLATIRYRVDVLHIARAIYVVGSDQTLHFQMVFAVAREAGWIPAGTRLEHAQIGLVLGPDGNRLRTRSGDNVQLSDLLQEAVDRARGILVELDAAARFDPAELDTIAEAVGIGAVKYADLSTARESAYVFDWDRMISFRGNTGPYLQYATARIRSIFRRADGEAAASAAHPSTAHSSTGAAAGGAAGIAITAGPERALALKLLGFGAVKYADLSTARESAYLFDWDRMISFRGNTGPYLQYATARIRSIFRRADTGTEAAGAGTAGAEAAGADADARAAGVAITAAPERALALRLLGFGTMVTQMGETAEPHRLCAYLFEVASLFTTFYEECPVLKAEPQSLRVSRLALCALTLDVLTKGLALLGVPVPERM